MYLHIYPLKSGNYKVVQGNYFNSLYVQNTIEGLLAKLGSYSQYDIAIHSKAGGLDKVIPAHNGETNT